ncbi:MAG: hypothetical protein RMJ82_13760, partial [Gemmatales bacterium]|nr:hypothetical protein [Gemmatales bacterium]
SDRCVMLNHACSLWLAHVPHRDAAIGRRLSQVDCVGSALNVCEETGLPLCRNEVLAADRENNNLLSACLIKPARTSPATGFTYTV